jgi:hypothetical protein
VLASPDAEKESNLPDTSDVLENLDKHIPFEQKVVVEGTKSAANSDDLTLLEKGAESIPTPLALEGGEHHMPPGAYRLSMSHPPQRVVLDSAEYEGSSSLRASSGRSRSSVASQRPETLLVEATFVEQDGNDGHGNTTSSHPGKPLANAQQVRESRIPRGCWYFGLVVVIALAASAGAIIAAQAGKRGTDKMEEMGDTATGRPTLAPTKFPTQAPVVASSFLDVGTGGPRIPPKPGPGLVGSVTHIVYLLFGETAAVVCHGIALLRHIGAELVRQGQLAQSSGTGVRLVLYLCISARRMHD